jgi:Flp pilus assembly protein TadD
MRRFLHFLILCCTFGFSSDAFSQSAPPFFGVYALHNGKFIELRGESTNQFSMNPSIVIRKPASIRIPDGKIQFVLYDRQYAILGAPKSVWVQFVARVAREIQPSSILGQGFDRPVNGLWIVRDRGYELRVAPFGNDKEMLLVRSADSNFVLPDGRYALVFDGQFYDFLVNKENPNDCVNQIIRSVGMTVEFTECELTPLQSGRAALSAKDYDRAITNLTEAIRLDRSSAVAYELRGTAYFSKGNIDSAIADYSEAIRLDPKAIVYWRKRAELYNRIKDYTRAISDYTEIIRLEPSAVNYQSRAYAYSSIKDFDRAIADFGESIRLNPTFFLYYDSRAQIYLIKMDYDKAIADLTEAIRLQPNRSISFVQRAEVYSKKGDHDRTIADYEAAIQIDRAQNVDASSVDFLFSQVAYYYFKKSDFDRAIVEYTKIISRASDGVGPDRVKKWFIRKSSG